MTKVTENFPIEMNDGSRERFSKAFSLVHVYYGIALTLHIMTAKESMEKNRSKPLLLAK